MKDGLIFLFVLLFSFSVCAIEISVEPAHINLSGIVGEKLCQEVKINSNENIIFLAEDKWSLHEEKGNFNAYKLKDKDIGLTSEYKKTFSSGDRFEFCASASKAGKYYGILLFKTSGGNGMIGSLVRLEVKRSEEKNWVLNSEMILGSLSLILILGLLIYSRRKID